MALHPRPRRLITNAAQQKSHRGFRAAGGFYYVGDSETPSVASEVPKTRLAVAPAKGTESPVIYDRPLPRTHGESAAVFDYESLGT